MALNLPDDPTPEQLKGIALATIRSTFEPDASDISDIEPYGDDGWQATYTADSRQFKIEYSPSEGFGKQPVGVAMEDDDE